MFVLFYVYNTHIYKLIKKQILFFVFALQIFHIDINKSTGKERILVSISRELTLLVQFI